MKTTNYTKSKLCKETKRLHALLSLETYKLLTKQSQKNNLTMTDYITLLINNTDESKMLKKQQSEINKIISLINFHKKIYTDLNATLSNLNQIAMRLNIDNIKDELKETISQSDFYHNTIKAINENRQELKEVRGIVVEVIQNLNAIYKAKTPRQKPKIIKKSIQKESA